MDFISGSGDVILNSTRWTCHLHKNSGSGSKSSLSGTSSSTSPSSTYSQSCKISCKIHKSGSEFFHVVKTIEVDKYTNENFNCLSSISSGSSVNSGGVGGSGGGGGSSSSSSGAPQELSVAMIPNRNSEFSEKLPNGPWFAPIGYTDKLDNIHIFIKILKILLELDTSHLRFRLQNEPRDFLDRHIINDARNNVCLCNKHLLKKVKETNCRYYTSKVWISKLIKEIFPKITNSKTKILVTYPIWVYDLIDLLPAAITAATLSKRNLNRVDGAVNANDIFKTQDRKEFDSLDSDSISKLLSFLENVSLGYG